MNYPNFSPDLRLLIHQHGHLCIGSVIGYRVCKYALKLVEKGPNLMVYTGSGGCLQHAIEILTGCSRENNTIINTEDPGWGFYDYTSSEGYRFSLKSELLKKHSGNKDDLIKVLLSLPNNEIFNVEAFERPQKNRYSDAPDIEKKDPIKSMA